MLRGPIYGLAVRSCGEGTKSRLRESAELDRYRYDDNERKSITCLVDWPAWAELWRVFVKLELMGF